MKDYDFNGEFQGQSCHKKRDFYNKTCTTKCRKSEYQKDRINWSKKNENSSKRIYMGGNGYVDMKTSFDWPIENQYLELSASP